MLPEIKLDIKAFGSFLKTNKKLITFLVLVSCLLFLSHQKILSLIGFKPLDKTSYSLEMLMCIIASIICILLFIYWFLTWYYYEVYIKKSVIDKLPQAEKDLIKTIHLKNRTSAITINSINNQTFEKLLNKGLVFTKGIYYYDSLCCFIYPKYERAVQNCIDEAHKQNRK
jgi:hypothetical protein